MSWTDAVVERLAPCTPRIRSVFLRSALPRHRAGQHVDVRLTADDGYEARRSYSIASAPGDDLLELLVERLDDGEVSPFFHDVVEVGDTIALNGPLGGHFVWSPDDVEPVLWIAGGSGVAPLAAMARLHATRRSTTPATLLHSARDWDALPLRDELIAAADPGSAFRYIATTTRDATPHAGHFTRRIDDAMLADVLAGWGHVPRSVYVCGSTPFVETVNAVLLRLGIAPFAIRAERYGNAA